MPSSPRSAFAALLAAASLAAFALGWFAHPAMVSPPPAALPTAKKPGITTATTAPADSTDAARNFDAVLAEPAHHYRQRLRLAQAAADLDRAGVLAALEHERATHSAYGSRTLPTEALLARFAELDPPAAMLWLAQSYPPERIEPDWLEVTLDTWISRDRKVASAWVAGLPDGDLRDRVTEEFFEQMVAIDPAGTARRITALSKADTYSFTSVFNKLAEKDLTVACQQAAQLPPDRAEGALLGIIQAWARRGPAEAYAWAAQIPPGSVKDSVTRQLYATWGGDDPAAAAAWLVAHGGADVSKYANELARRWAAVDLASARAWSEALPAHARAEAVSSVLSAWEETDPRAAMDYAMTLPGRQRETGISNVLSQWARSDLDAARAWMEQQGNSSGGAHEGILAAVCGAWASDNPRACAEYLAQRSGDEAAQQQLSQTLSTWASESPEEVWRWGQGQTDTKVRSLAAVEALEVLATHDPTQASARLGQLPPDAQPEAAGKVAENWVVTDPAAAGRWAASLPAGEARASAVEAVAGIWGQDDAAQAVAWLTAQPPGDARDKGISAGLRAMQSGGMDPQAALRLAQAVQDPDMRQAALTEVAEAWLRRDRAAAGAWIAQCPEFTPEIRTQLMEKPSEPDPTLERTVVTP